ncbi:hypothetical protein [Rhizobium nepotum]|uniref:hypothetical protein n=1 Tax=Rhizobium nepotum TaxID=1035271 RepID=UPI003CE74F81
MSKAPRSTSPATGTNDYGDYEPLENLGPGDDMDEAIRAIEANETAVDILVAQCRTHFGDWPVAAVIRELGA